jgi:hypothetical protein
MAELDPALRRVKQAIEKDLLNRPGVAGVDIGYKEVGGERTDQLAIRVHVNEKRDVAPEERVPQSIEGFPTDVIERKWELQVLAVDAQQVAVQADAEQYESLKGGMSIGPCRSVGGTFLGGTLGLPVTDNVTGKSMLLSNFHVLCGDLSWTVGDFIAQPARIDRGTCPSAIVAAVQRAALGEQVDCAVAEVTARTAGSEVVEIGEVAGINVVSIDEPVRKRGRTTGLTYGFVDGIDGTVIVSYPGIGEVTLSGQIDVRPDTTRNPKFSAAGDSGSVVVNAAGEAVGLHFAGNDADGHGAANPIASVLAALNVSIPGATTTAPQPPVSQPPPVVVPPVSQEPPVSQPPPVVVPPVSQEPPVSQPPPVVVSQEPPVSQPPPVVVPPVSQEPPVSQPPPSPPQEPPPPRKVRPPVLKPYPPPYPPLEEPPVLLRFPPAQPLPPWGWS